MNIRMTNLNIENKVIESIEMSVVSGAIVRIKYKEDDKIKLNYDIDVVNNGRVLINIKSGFLIDDKVECNSTILKKAVEELEERIEILVALACEESGFNIM